MAKFRYLISLITQDNDYQRKQAACAKAAAQEFGIEVEIVYAGNDAITQSTQLLKSHSGRRQASSASGHRRTARRHPFSEGRVRRRCGWHWLGRKLIARPNTPHNSGKLTPLRFFR